MESRTYSAVGLDSLLRNCFLASIRQLPDNGEYTVFNEEDEYYDVDYGFTDYFDAVSEQLGYTNDRAFRMAFPPPSQPNYYYSEPILGATDIPLRQFRAVTLELNIHKDGSIYPLPFEVVREYAVEGD